MRDHEYTHLPRIRVVFRLPEGGRRHAGLPAIRRHSRLHADGAVGGAHHAVAVSVTGAIRHRRLGVCIRRRHFGPADRRIRRSLRSEEAAALLLYRFHRGHRLVRRRPELRIAAAGAHRHRIVRRRHRLRRTRHRDRPVCAADARPRHGFHPDGIRRQPGPRHSDRHLSIEPMELARAVSCAGGTRRDRRIADRRVYEAGRGPFEAAAGTHCVQTSAATP